MAETTGISWADRTWSPWTGCTRVSPACDGCYAAHLMDARMHRAAWGGPGAGEGTRDRMSDSYWKKPLIWNRQAERDGTRPFIFPSLCDPFDKAVDPEWRRDFFAMMRATPQLVWLLLTKRAGLIERLTAEAGGLPTNAALGATVINQEEAERDVPKLLAAKAALRPAFAFLSMEPLLGPVDLFRVPCTPWPALQRHGPGLDWIIAGGETDQGGHKARPSHPDWFRSLRDQSSVAGVPFHFKQWGEWAPMRADFIPVPRERQGWVQVETGLVVQAKAEADLDVIEREESRADRPLYSHMARVGKALTGRTLDEVMHDFRPQVAA